MNKSVVEAWKNLGKEMKLILKSENFASLCLQALVSNFSSSFENTLILKAWLAPFEKVIIPEFDYSWLFFFIIIILTN